MINGISGLNFYYNPYQGGGPAASKSLGPSQNTQKTSGVWMAHKPASPETPVQPVRPVPAISPNEAGSARLGLPVRQGADPVEMAVRMRIQYGEPTPEGVRQPDGAAPGLGAESVQKAAEEGECQTCKERKYQDGSDDSSVSYQTPTHIDADYAPAAVRGHELEHVAHEQAKAQREDRKVVSQTVTLHTDICPECGRVYVSGGTTRTVTKADNTEAPAREEQDGAEK